MKLKTQNSKLSISSKSQTPVWAHGTKGRGRRFLELLAWCFSGALSFEPGVSNRRRLLALSVALAALGGSAFAGEPAAWPLLPSAQVDSAGIFLHQIVGLQISIPLPSTRLAPAPALGQTASFSRAQINELLHRGAPELIITNWSGAAQIRVTRRLRPLGETELRALLTATLQSQFVKDKGELELRFRSPWAALNVPDEALTLKVVDFPATGVSGSFIIRFELLTVAEKAGEWQVVAQGRLWREVLVARAALKRGQLLAASDVVAERRDVVGLREPLGPSVLEETVLELSENLAEGQPLLGRSVRPRPVMQRGRVVDAVITDGALNISMKVEVLADGLLGQTVRVRNPRTKKEFLGKVQNEQTVLVAL